MPERQTFPPWGWSSMAGRYHCHTRGRQPRTAQREGTQSDETGGPNSPGGGDGWHGAEPFPRESRTHETLPTCLGGAPIACIQSTLTQREGAGVLAVGCVSAQASPSWPNFPPASQHCPKQPAPPNRRSSHRGPTARPPACPGPATVRGASRTAHGQVCASYPQPDGRKRQSLLFTVP